MKFIIAGILAAAVSRVGNRAALRVIGAKVIVATAPLVEEAAKTGAALTMGASLVLTHSFFGLIEGVYDAWGSGFRGISAGLVSLAGHAFYGYITYLIWQHRAGFGLALAGGYIVHLLWNLTVMKFVVQKKGV